MFVGNGFDIHKHSKDANLILGGIHIDGDGFEAHSDGDIILHSLCDALLGSKAKKDLGYYFPSNKTTPKGISSVDMLNKVLEISTTYVSFAILSIGCDATMSNQCKQRTALLQDAIHLQSINMHISRHNIDIDVVPGTLVSNLTISRLLYMNL